MLSGFSHRLAVTALVVAASVGPALAQARTHMEAATYSGVANTMILSRVPVVDANGRLSYKDVTIPFAVSSTGVLTAGAAKVTASPSLAVGFFVAGKYKNGSAYFHVSGPGVGPDGRTTWSIESADCPDFNAAWTTGPVAGHPAEARLTKVGITYGGIAYGAGGGTDYCYDTIFWRRGTLIGAAGGPTGLTLYSYTKSYADAGAPWQSLSFKLCTSSTC